MSEILKVLNRKVELKSEVVEFATFANPKTQIQKIEKLNAEIKEQADKLYSLKQEATKVAKNSVDLSQRIIRELESDKKEFTAKVKELGIDASKLPQTKEFDSAIKKGGLYVKNIMKMENTITK
tara:strand:- start:182 stop:553 length:372 start_codon:yes stop_codon:yes gene_type:complete